MVVISERIELLAPKGGLLVFLCPALLVVDRAFGLPHEVEFLSTR